MNRFRMNLGPAVPSWPSLEISAEEREFIRQVFALTPIQPIAYVGTSDWDAACTRLQEVICKAESAGFSGSDIDAVTDGIDLTCAEGLDDATARLNAAVLLSVAMPHVTLKPEPVREVKPAISGLTTVRGE